MPFSFISHRTGKGFKSTLPRYKLRGDARGDTTQHAWGRANEVLGRCARGEWRLLVCC
ncbi:hypothetical protein ERO13_D06G182900v2 [Gossypium hirsutum]|uniref:Uncharacterized protein n=1 Tax=Gossypium barbadense TaxID=3634 RepID=A0A5J5RC95_GOSBA|nr:hypothetical protein ES319_D06G216900v1 [Gossypium barbadense]KAG4143352.1 hypothetical protein ERO13_D06G182900v2 [Gossypium hirsutum]